MKEEFNINKMDVDKIKEINYVDMHLFMQPVLNKIEKSLPLLDRYVLKAEKGGFLYYLPFIVVLALYFSFLPIPTNNLFLVVVELIVTMVLLCFCAVFMFIEHKNMQGVLWRLGKKLKQKSSIVLNSYIQKLTINEQKLFKLYLEKSEDDVFFYDVLFVNDRMVKRILKSK
jgi:hypothetical protein